MVNNVTVLGSLNVDTILRIARLPKPGETMPMSDKNNAGEEGCKSGDCRCTLRSIHCIYRQNRRR